MKHDIKKKKAEIVLYPNCVLIDLDGNYFEVVDGEVTIFSDGSQEGGELESIPRQSIGMISAEIFDLRHDL